MPLVATSSADLATANAKNAVSKIKNARTKMTNAELAALPVGAIIQLDDEQGTIRVAGRQVQIEWDWLEVTSLIDTDAEVWESLVVYFKAVT